MLQPSDGINGANPEGEFAIQLISPYQIVTKIYRTVIARSYFLLLLTFLFAPIKLLHC